MRILLVDDDDVVAMILRSCNYQVTTVKYPMDALSTLSLKGDSFDLVVTNVHVPDMNGSEFPQVITQGFELPVVLMSADKDGSNLKGRKKAKVEWTMSLHHKFLEAILEIGLDKVAPLKILDHMNVPGLTRDNVASHLQRYRNFLRRVTDQCCKTQAADKNLATKAVQENCGLQKQFFENYPSSSVQTSTGHLTGNLQHLKNKGKEVDAVLDPVCNSSVFHNINATQEAQHIGYLSTSFTNQGNVQPHQQNNEDDMSVNFDGGINQDMEEKDHLQ